MELHDNHYVAGLFDFPLSRLQKIASGFEWDEAKNIVNAEKHQIDFPDASELFELKRRITIITRSGNDDARFKTTGILKNKLFTVVYTLRDNTILIISARRAWPNEARAYRQLYAG